MSLFIIREEKRERIEIRLYAVKFDLLTPVCRASLRSSSEKKREKIKTRLYTVYSDLLTPLCRAVSLLIVREEQREDRD
jgi:uncharacterized protein YbaR (Trm112 family)